MDYVASGTRQKALGLNLDATTYETFAGERSNSECPLMPPT
jgi:hypothetical protein